MAAGTATLARPKHKSGVLRALVAPTRAPARPAVALDAAVTTAGGPVSVEQVVELQRLAGNAAVAALMAARSAAPPSSGKPTSATVQPIPVSRQACCDSCAGGGGCESDREPEHGAAPDAAANVQRVAEPAPEAAVQRFGWDDVKNAGNAIGRGVSNATSAVGDKVSGAARAVGNTVSGAARAVGNTVAGAARGVGNAVASGARAVAGAAASLVPDWVKDLFSSAPAKAERQHADAEHQSTAAIREAGAAEERTKGQAHAASTMASGAARSGLDKHQETLTSGYTSARQRSTAVHGAAVGGLKALAGVAAPALVPFVNPAISIARPGTLDQAAERIGSAGAQVAEGVGKSVAPGLRQAGSAFDGYKWNCDFSEIASRAGGVGRGVLNSAVSLADLVTHGRASQALAFGGKLADGIRSAGNFVKGKISGYAGQLKGFLAKKIGPVMDAAKAVAARVRAGVSKLADQVRLRAGQARDLAVKAFNGAKAEIARRVGMIGSNLRAAGSALLNRIRQGLQIAGSVIDVLFPGARGLVDRITAGIERGIERARAIAATVKAKLAAAKDNVVAFVRAKADEALKNAIRLGHTIGEKLSQATKWIADHKMQILAAVPGGLLLAAIGGAVVVGAGKVRQAAAAVAKKASGAVCTAVGAGAGACADQYLPNPGGGQTATLTFTSKADLTVPLHEVGVPCSAKLARGAQVTIKRSGDVFTMTIKGDSSVTAVENLEASAGATGALETGSGGKGSVWQKLGGQNANANAPAGGGGGGALPAVADAVGAAAAAKASAPAPTASQVGGQAAGGGGTGGAAAAASPGASFSAGVKGTLEQEYEFNAKGNACAGLGGMLTLNAALGTAAMLPEPLGALASSGVQGAFLNQMQKSTFTAAAEGSAELKLFEAGGAAAAVKITAELSAAAGRRRATDADRDPTKKRAGAIDADGFIEELTLGGKLSGEGTLTLPGSGPISGISATVTPEVSVALTLMYARDRGRIEPEKAEAKAAIVADLHGLDFSAVERLLPAGGSVAVERLRRFALADKDTKATVGIETSISVNDLDSLYLQMEQYFATPETVTVGGTIDLVRKHLATGVVRSTKVTLTRSDTMSLKLGASATAEGATIGANAEASMVSGIETQIYPAVA